VRTWRYRGLDGLQKRAFRRAGNFEARRLGICAPGGSLGPQEELADAAGRYRLCLLQPSISGRR
jgi:hypothetical protein